MDLARLRIKLRPRTPWEGIDLGFSLSRHWFIPLWLLWMTSAVPMFILLNLLLPIPLWLAGVLAWWFKPLYEPPLVYWLGRAAFGERPGFGEMRRQWRRSLGNQLFSNLTWRRFNPSRSFAMPVAVLEGLKGKGRAARIRVLSRRQHAASWLTIMGIHFEVILEFGLLVLLAALLPEELRSFEYAEFLFEPSGWQQWLQQFTGLLAMSVIAPFYVAAGFGLYLTRRGELEAWDIELGMRRLAKRMSDQRRVAVVMPLLAILLVGTWLPSPNLQAVELTGTEARSLIESVMEEDDFGERETQTSWKYIGQSEAEDETETHWLFEWLSDLLSGFTQGFATIGEILMWLASGALIVYLIVWFVRNQDRFGGELARRKAARELPRVVLGMDIRPEALPADIASAALDLLGRGEPRAALGLLYRGSLSVLVHRHSLRVPDGATEGECLQLAGEVLDPQGLAYQTSLTRAWRELAYAHAEFETGVLEGLCSEWGRIYGQ